MIFKQKKIIQPNHYVKFAFLPVKLKNGDTIWLERYYSVYEDIPGTKINYFGIFSLPAADWFNYTTEEFIEQQEKMMNTIYGKPKVSDGI